MVMEVHPPEHPIFTWKQFFIHMATICLGLLIALGLEQAVEAMHRRHQRAELVEAIQKDDQKSLADIPDEERDLKAHFDWLDARMEQVRSAMATGSPITFIPQVQGPVHSIPAEPAWEAAKTSNMVDVLSQSDIKAYSEIDSLLATFNKSYDEGLDTAVLHRTAFEEQFCPSADCKGMDFSRASHADLVQYLTLLSEERTETAWSYDEIRYLRGGLTAVTRGERNLDRIDDEELKAAESRP